MSREAKRILPLRSISRHARFLSVPGEAKIVTSLLDGRIKAVGLEGETSGGLLIKIEDVQPLILESRHTSLGDTRSAAESAMLLKCDLAVISSLVGSGHLRSIRKPWGMRVTEESLAAFSSAYSSLAGIAKEHGVSSIVLIGICERNGIDLFRSPRRNPDHPQPFIAKQHERLLMPLLEEHKIRSRLRGKKSAKSASPQVARYAQIHA